MIIELNHELDNKAPGILTHKQSLIYQDLMRQDWFMAILYGAKRTGKTIFNNMLFLRELKRVRKTADKLGIKNPMYILAGYSLGTIQKNVLQELSNMYGFEFKFDKYNRFVLYGVTVVQTGHGSISGLGAIRGMTSFGAYVNEASLAHELVFDEIKSRCSGEGARILADTNPDHPEHYLLKDYIENPSETIRAYHFELMDNTFLTRRYIDNIIASTPTGMFFDRNIKGLWVSGDGVVYADFDKEVNVITAKEFEDISVKRYFAGVDWGFEHYGAIVVCAQDFEGNYYLIEEHAHKGYTIDQWVDVAKSVIKKYGNIPFYCDTARTEHIYRFKQKGINAIYGNKRVMEGIEYVSSLFKKGKLFVIYENCPRFRNEIYKYVWHKTEDKPVKEFDDVLDALRYALMTFYKLSHRQDKDKVAKAIRQIL